MYESMQVWVCQNNFRAGVTDRKRWGVREDGIEGTSDYTVSWEVGVSVIPTSSLSCFLQFIIDSRVLTIRTDYTDILFQSRVFYTFEIMTQASDPTFICVREQGEKST